jgi:hypothetical protein
MRSDYWVNDKTVNSILTNPENGNKRINIENSVYAYLYATLCVILIGGKECGQQSNGSMV